MSVYAIGDVQGCFSALQQILSEIHFDAAKDTLWFTGDLVNRGPQSLEVLRFVRGLGDRHKTVLGNHDLHLLSMAYGLRDPHEGDTLTEILNAPDKKELMDWLRHQPLIHYDQKNKYVLVHAGLAPMWDLQLALALSKEVEKVLQSASPEYFLKEMYGNAPDEWREDLTGMDRLRCITNYCTRLRYCHLDGRLEFSTKGKVESSEKLIPWFKLPERVNKNLKIIFGHWASLEGRTDTPNVYALDTGCVWGECLTAMRLEDEKRFEVRCE